MSHRNRGQGTYVLPPSRGSCPSGKVPEACDVARCGLNGLQAGSYAAGIPSAEMERSNRGDA